MADLFLIAGLGNPGSKYERTRHNIGVRVVQRLAERAGVSLAKSKFKGESAKARIAGVEALLLTPHTYMNLSGESVGPAARFFDVPPERVVVLHDELEIPFGRLRLKQGGGHAGHNGLKSLIQHLGSRDFHRVRVGIGRPPPGQEVAAYVLNGHTPDELPRVPELIDVAADATEALLSEGLVAAMNRYNSTQV